MEVDTTRQNLTINKLVSTKKQTVTIEGDIIVPDVKPDILNTIDSVGNVCVYKKEVLDGKVRIDGGVNVYLIYLADSQTDTTRGLNTTLDFTQIMDMEACKLDMDVISNLGVKNIECKVLNGRKVNIKAEVEIEMQIYSNENIKILKEINNISEIQTLNSKMNVNTLIGKGSTKAFAKDTISYDNSDNLMEILKAEVRVVNQEIKTSYNKVLLKADANTKIMYLTEDGSIRKTQLNIPIIGFVDVADVSEDNIIDSNFEIKNIIIKPNSTEQHSIYIEIEVEIGCRVYGTNKFELIQDMYSTEEEINFTTRRIETERNKKNKKDICDINEKVVIPEIANNEIYDVEINPIINNMNILNGRIIYEGELNLNFLFSSNVSLQIEAKDYKIPFSFEVNDDCINSNKNIITKTECIGDSFKIVAEGTIECNIKLQFNMDMYDTAKINIIDEIKVAENRNNQQNSMTIYIVKSGDSLWNIAKKYRTTIENIMRLNNLEEDKINVGEKLYIQRYNVNMIQHTA